MPLAQLDVQEIDEAIANARASLKAARTHEHAEAIRAYIDDLLDRRVGLAPPRRLATRA